MALDDKKNGVLLESLSFMSQTLKEEMRYSIYLPECYSLSNRKYPVVYLFHSARGDETSWVQYGRIKEIADDLITSNRISPMIIVMPSGITESSKKYGSLFIDDTVNEFKYEDMFINELIPHVEDEFRVRSSKEFRGIAGCATGGFASLYYPYYYPELFSCSMSMSAALLNDDVLMGMEDEFYERNFGRYIGFGYKGLERTNGNFQRLNLLKKIDNESYKGVKLHISCGDKDFKGMVTVTNSELHMNLYNNGIDHEFRMRDGGHTWSYWRDNISESLEFANRQFLKS